MDVHAVPLLEVCLRLARHDGCEMKDHVRASCDERADGGRVDEVGDDRLGGKRGALGRGRLDHVCQREAADRNACQRPVAGEAPRELAPEHARRAEDQDPHGRTVLEVAHRH